MMLNFNFWKNKKVLITGCTGFSGSWLVIFLNFLQSKVIGYSLKPPSKPSLFNIMGLKNKIRLYNGDINNYNSLKKIINKEKPDVVFHLAANAIVLDCHRDPINTYKTNSFGVLNLLEILRSYKKKITVNIVTSDKCYVNSSKKLLFNEESPLGGDDVYSASKAVAEIMVKSYQKYFSSNIKITTIRSGNIIGGGDWGKYRLITDLVLSKFRKKKINIRNMNSIRPWQHIYDVIHGYLLISQFTSSSKQFHSWNVAPHDSRLSVKKIYYFFFKKKIEKKLLKKNIDIEKKTLTLDSKKIFRKLKWKPIYTYKIMMADIFKWYEVYYSKKDIKKYSYNSLNRYFDRLKK
ncbi:CDP-glucose 4,6-dehydratase [Candidatus Pelagibacter sp.]|uniref:CDP-glucose 4,6-dehydratase n=1 Tax=Candidatus Pelagibacter sp. TaxID=2024849 RepID=UPI003F859984